jgi:PilZ domain-containing protein
MDPLARDSSALDISLGGLRVYSDYPLTIGVNLNIELQTEGCPRVSCTVAVVRVSPLGRGGPAPYEVGLRFVHFDPIAVKVLLHVLGRDDSWQL